jgi:hypothetical protein
MFENSVETEKEKKRTIRLSEGDIDAIFERMDNAQSSITCYTSCLRVEEKQLCSQRSCVVICQKREESSCFNA